MAVCRKRLTNSAPETLSSSYFTGTPPCGISTSTLMSSGGLRPGGIFETSMRFAPPGIDLSRACVRARGHRESSGCLDRRSGAVERARALCRAGIARGSLADGKYICKFQPRRSHQTVKIEREIPIQIDPGENPFLKGIYAPIATEITADDLTVIGELPKDLDGAYLRNGPNPIFQPRGRYHWFDGDGMIHAIEFRDGKATYRNRWITTQGFVEEQKEQRSIWPGLMDKPDLNAPHGAGSDGWLKDTANTDVVFHNGHALALWYQCGLPYKLNARTLETLGVENFRGALKRTVSAHAKVDPVTGELLFFDYATKPPFMTYNVVSAKGELTHHIPVEVLGPRLPHDMAFTERYSILMDLPLFWDPELLA